MGKSVCDYVEIIPHKDGDITILAAMIDGSVNWSQVLEQLDREVLGELRDAIDNYLSK